MTIVDGDSSLWKWSVFGYELSLFFVYIDVCMHTHTNKYMYT